jgi:hypothetical protein
LLHVKLHEGARQFLCLPRRGRLASAQANDHVLPARRLPWVKRDILNDPVALVEDAKNCNTLRHRGDPALSARGGHRLRGPARRHVLLLGALAAGGKGERDQDWSYGASHAYSGIQGS